MQTDQIRLQLLKQEYNRFSKAADLPMQYERMEKAGFDWKKGKVAEKVARSGKKDFTSAAENSTIKSLDIDDFEMLAEMNEIQPEVSNIIGNTIKEFESAGGMYISEVHLGEFYDSTTGKPAIFQVFMDSNGLVGLNINTEKLAGKSLSEIDSMIANTERNIPKTLKEAVIHECGHAKAYYRKTVKEVSEMNAALADRGVDGISAIASVDGAECIVEVEVLLYKGDPVPDEAMALYNEYVKGARP